MTQFNQMLDLFVLRPVVHRVPTTGCSPGEGRSSTMHTNSVQLQKHLAAVLDVKGRGCWKQGEETNEGVAISSQLTDAFISPNSSSYKRLKELYFFQLLIDITIRS